MTRKSNKKLLSFILSTMLIVAMALCMTGCNGNVMDNPLEKTESGGTTEMENSQTGDIPTSDATVLGKGNTVFNFTVVGVDGAETTYEIHTDKETVGEALMEVGLLEGEEGPYGLYVKTVDGTTLDYDKDGMYWSFYINGSYAMTGVDVTTIADGETYMFKAEKS